MKIQKVPRLILALLLYFTIAEACGNGGHTNQEENTSCPSPPKFKPIPAPTCPSRIKRALEFFRTKRAAPYVEYRTNEQIRNEHNQLINQGYVFAGWHGTSFQGAQKLVGGAPYRISPRQGDDRIWMGAYTADDIRICLGYPGPDGTFVLLRAYFLLPYDAASRTFIDVDDINNAVDPKQRPDICNRQNPTYSEMLQGQGRYLVCGPDGTDQGDELCISQDYVTTTNLKFLYSAHNQFITISGHCPKLNPNSNDIEVTSVNWALNNNNNFINSMKSAQVFK